MASSAALAASGSFSRKCRSSSSARPLQPPRPAPPLKERGEEAPPRKPYVIGNSYASLPGGCMKMIEEGAHYYYCGGGEWYRQRAAEAR